MQWGERPRGTDQSDGAGSRGRDEGDSRTRRTVTQFGRLDHQQECVLSVQSTAQVMSEWTMTSGTVVCEWQAPGNSLIAGRTLVEEKWQAARRSPHTAGTGV